MNKKLTILLSCILIIASSITACTPENIDTEETKADTTASTNTNEATTVSETTTKPEVKDTTLKIMDNVLNSVSFPKGMSYYTGTADDSRPLDSDSISANFGDSDFSIFEEYAIYLPMRASSQEVGILRLKDVKNMDKAEKIVKDRIAGIQKAFEEYLEDQKLLADKAVYEINEDYIFYVISEDNDKAIASIKSDLGVK